MLSDKIAQLLEGTLSADEAISVELLPSIGVRIARHRKTIMFEASVAFSSTHIGELGELFIGSHSYMNDGGYIRGVAAVGRFCSIGRRVSIGAAPHKMVGLSTHPKLRFSDPNALSEQPDLLAVGAQPDRVMGPTVIESDVWIGDGAVILAGVKVGIGAVIGANAVVRSDVAPYSIVAGAPARTVRSRFSPTVIAALLASQWWEASVETITALPVWDVNRLLRIFADTGGPLPSEHLTYCLQQE